MAKDERSERVVLANSQICYLPGWLMLAGHPEGWPIFRVRK